MKRKTEMVYKWGSSSFKGIFRIQLCLGVYKLYKSFREWFCELFLNLGWNFAPKRWKWKCRSVENFQPLRWATVLVVVFGAKIAINARRNWVTGAHPIYNWIWEIWGPPCKLSSLAVTKTDLRLTSLAEQLFVIWIMRAVFCGAGMWLSFVARYEEFSNHSLWQDFGTRAVNSCAVTAAL